MSEWAVFEDWSESKAREILRVTKAKTIVRRPYNSGEQHLLSENVIAVLPEPQAKAMVEKLVSSDALKREEQRQAGARHLSRVAKIKAEFVPSPPTQPREGEL